MWKPNQQIDNDRFLIQSVLGGGSYGIAYLAIDLDTEKQVVIKTLNPVAQSRTDFEVVQTNFVKEAFRLAKCSHPQVVKMLNVIKHDDLWGIVMEYIDGDDLDVYLQTQGVFIEAEALEYIDQIGQALEHIHEQGLLHRDIKPSNIVLRRETNRAVLIDFGLAREYTTDRSRSMTNAKTDGYAPIEQYERNGNFGQHTDVYALAATLYSLLTGEIPLPANFRRTGIELVAPQTHRQRNPKIEISDRVNTAILKGMALQPEDRPSTIAAFRDLLGLTNQQQNKSAAQICYEQGYRNFQIESYPEAIDCFNKAINLDRDQSSYYHNRGCSYLALAINRSSVNVSETELDKQQLLIYNCTQAIWNFTLAIGLEPFYKKYYYYRGRAYFELNYFQQAIDNFCLHSDIDQTQEKISGVHLNWDLSDEFESLSDDECESLSNEACEHFYIYSDIILDGNLILNEKHYFEGEQIFSNILNKGCQRIPNKLVPVDMDHDSELNLRIAERKSMSRSFQENSRLLSQKDDNFQIVFLDDEPEFSYRARAYFDLKQYQLAISDYNKIIDTEEYNNVVCLAEDWGLENQAYLGLVYSDKNDEYYHEKNYYKKFPKSNLFKNIREILFESYEKIVNSYFQLSDYKSGILYCRKAIALCQRHQYLIPVVYLNKKAEMYSKLGYYHAAIKNYTSLIDLNPQVGEYYLSRAEASTKIETNQPSETKRLSKFLNPPALDDSTFNYDGYEPTIYDTFESLSDYHGYDYNDYYDENDDLAGAKARLDNYRNADSYIDKYELEDERKADEKKVLQLKLEYCQKAIEDYDRAIVIDPTNPQTYVKRGGAYLQLATYYNLIRNDYRDRDYDYLEEKEMQQLELGYYYKTIETYKQAIALDSTSVFTDGEGEDLPTKLNKYENAIESYIALIDSDLDNVDNHQKMSKIFLLSKLQSSKSYLEDCF